MWTANGIMKELYINSEVSSNGRIDVNEDHLYELLLMLEKHHFNTGYNLGYRNGLQVERKSTPLDTNYETVKLRWATDGIYKG